MLPISLKLKKIQHMYTVKLLIQFETQSPFNSVFERNLVENNDKIILRALE